MSGFNENIDRFVKEKWLALGLSQTDLAEILDAALEQVSKNDNGSDRVVGERLTKIAEALNVPADSFQGRAAKVEADSSAQRVVSLQSLIELRLLRAFQTLRDHRIKLMLVHLAERLVRRQTNRHGDAG